MTILDLLNNKRLKHRRKPILVNYYYYPIILKLESPEFEGAVTEDKTTSLTLPQLSTMINGFEIIHFDDHIKLNCWTGIYELNDIDSERHDLKQCVDYNVSLTL